MLVANPAFASGTTETSAPASTPDSTTADDFWVTGWYAGWYQNDMPPSEIDFSIVTHLMHFMIVPRADGSLEVSGRPGFESPQRIASVVNATHAAGRKVLITVGGAGSYTGFKSAIQPGARGALVRNLADFVRVHHYDGVDVDMEPVNPDDYANFTAFVTELRAALDELGPDKLLTVAAGPARAICPIQDKFDQINIMTYDMSGTWGGWVVWHNSPIHNGGTKFPTVDRYLPSSDLYAQSFIDAGCASSKIAIGLDFYGYVWAGGTGTDTGGATRPLQRWETPPSVYGNVPYFDIARSYELSSAQWDEMAAAAYLSIDREGSAQDRFVSYDNERTAHAKVAYARERGHGGIAIWELAGGYLRDPAAPVRDPLLQAVGEAVRGGAPAQPPVTPTPLPPATAVPPPTATATPEPTVTATPQPTATPPPTATATPTLMPTGTPPAGDTETGERVLSDGSLDGSWIDISWGVSNQPRSTEQSYRGTPAFRAKGAGAVALRNGPWHRGIPLHPGEFETVEIAVHPGDRDLRIRIAGGNDLTGWFAATTAGTVPAGQWSVIELPMSALSPQGRPIHKLYIAHSGDSATVMHLGAIVAKVGGAVTPAPTPSPTPAPTPAPTAAPTPAPNLMTVFDDAVVSPWFDISWGVSNSIVTSAVAADGSTSTTRLFTSRGSGALAFRHGPWHAGIAVPSASVQALRVLVRPNAPVGLVVAGGNDQQGWFSPAIVDTLPADRWTLVEIPISKLSPGASAIHKFYIGPKGGSAGTELQFQEIGFTLRE